TTVAADSTGNAYLLGRTANTLLIEKLSADGTTVLYRTVIGSGYNATGEAIAVNSTGKAYITGFSGANLPTTGNAFQTTIVSGNHTFVGVLDATGTVTYMSYLAGTNGADQGNGIAVDSTGKMYITGFTSSTTYPTTPGVFQTAASTGGQTGF